MKKWKTLDSKLVLDEKFMKVKKERVKTSDGTEISWIYIDSKDAVVVVPVTPDGKVIAIRQYRHTIRDFALEVPAGLTAPGERPEHCARREVSEETGYKTDELVKLGELYEAYSQNNRKMHVFLARVSSKGKKNLDRGGGLFEEIETVEMPFEKILSEITRSTTSAIFPAALFMLKQRIEEGEVGI